MPGYGNPLKIASDYWRKKGNRVAESSLNRAAASQLSSLEDKPKAKAPAKKAAAPAGTDAPLSAARIARNKRLMKKK